MGAQTSRSCPAGPVSYLLGSMTLTGYFFANYPLFIYGFPHDNKLTEILQPLSWPLLHSAHSIDFLLARSPFRHLHEMILYYLMDWVYPVCDGLTPSIYPNYLPRGGVWNRNRG